MRERSGVFFAIGTSQRAIGRIRWLFIGDGEVIFVLLIEEPWCSRGFNNLGGNCLGHLGQVEFFGFACHGCGMMLVAKSINYLNFSYVV